MAPVEKEQLVWEQSSSRSSAPGVGLLPSFSHSELVIQALTLPFAPLHMPQPPRLHGGCSGEGEEHPRSRAQLRAPGGKPSKLVSHCSSQLGQWGCHAPPNRDIWIPDALHHQAATGTGARSEPAQRPRGTLKWPRASPIRSPNTTGQAGSPEEAD